MAEFIGGVIKILCYHLMEFNLVNYIICNYILRSAHHMLLIPDMGSQLCGLHRNSSHHRMSCKSSPIYVKIVSVFLLFYQNIILEGSVMT